MARQRTPIDVADDEPLDIAGFKADAVVTADKPSAEEIKNVSEKSGFTSRESKAKKKPKPAEKMKRLNVIVEEPLLKRMKSFALEEGKTVSDITRELWLNHMSK